jgi:hypothetical protein
MNNGLMYIYQGAPAEQHVERITLAESLGFNVTPVPNETYMPPVHEEIVLNSMTPNNFMGVWVDVEMQQIGVRTGRIIQAAGRARINLLGRQDPSMNIERNITGIIGIPERNQ